MELITGAGAGTALVVHEASTGFTAMCPTYIGSFIKAVCDVTSQIPSPQQFINAANATLADCLPGIAEDVVKKTSILGFNTSVGTLAAYSVSAVAITWPILYEAASFVGSICQDWSVSRKVTKMTSRLANLKVKDQASTLTEANSLIKDIKTRVATHNENAKPQSFFSPETLFSVAIPAVALLLTGAGVGLGVGALAAVGVAGATLTTRAVSHAAYKLRHAGMAHLQEGYLKQLEQAVETAKTDIKGQV